MNISPNLFQTRKDKNNYTTNHPVTAKVISVAINANVASRAPMALHSAAVTLFLRCSMIANMANAMIPMPTRGSIMRDDASDPIIKKNTNL